MRRDGVPATAKILRRMIEILFKTYGDLSACKAYFQRAGAKILAGRVSVQASGASAGGGGRWRCAR